MICRYTFVILTIIFLISSCKKKNVEPEPEITPPPANNPAPPNLVFGIPPDADGIFMASFIPYRFTDNSTTYLGNASVFLFEGAGKYKYVDGGVIKSGDTVIPKISGGSYYFAANPQHGSAVSGLDHSSGSYWNIAGNASAGVPTFSVFAPDMPFMGTLSSPPNASRSQPYEATITTFNDADSIVVLLSCDSVTVKKTIGGNEFKCNFTAAEMGSVKKANSFKQGSFTIIPYRVSISYSGGKKYYFYNSVSSTYILYIGA